MTAKSTIRSQKGFFLKKILFLHSARVSQNALFYSFSYLLQYLVQQLLLITCTYTHYSCLLSVFVWDGSWDCYWHPPSRREWRVTKRITWTICSRGLFEMEGILLNNPPKLTLVECWWTATNRSFRVTAPVKVKVRPGSSLVSGKTSNKWSSVASGIIGSSGSEENNWDL